MRPLLLKAQFNLVSADILKKEIDQSFVVFHISLQINVSSTNNMQRNGSIKSLPCNGLLLPLYEMDLKSRSYIIDLDQVKLSWGLFFFLSCLIETFFHQLSGSTLIFVKNTHQKATNLMFCLISPVAKTLAWFLEGQYIVFKLMCTYFTINDFPNNRNLTG